MRVGAAVDRLDSGDRDAHPATPRAAWCGATLGAGVSVEMADRTPVALATLKHAASMPNPAFFDRQRRRFSTWGNPGPAQV